MRFLLHLSTHIFLFSDRFEKFEDDIDIDTVAGVVKLFIYKLPQNLTTAKLRDQYREACESKFSRKQKRKITNETGEGEKEKDRGRQREGERDLLL